MEVTDLLIQWKKNDQQANQQLYSFCYEHFKQVAHKIRQKHFLKTRQPEDQNEYREVTEALHNTTSLVHDAYIRLAQSGNLDTSTRAAFFKNFANVVYSILIDHTRRTLSKKRTPQTIQPNLTTPDTAQLEKIIDVNNHMNKLRDSHERQISVFQLKYACGLDVAEISDIFAVSKSSVEKDLTFVKRKLSQSLTQTAPAMQTVA
ncbi:MAG: ECF-type sigma factor [Pseudomonadota bacterium]|nr:ECF-type sigma factor [Pseudomonadota bacterium]